MNILLSYKSIDKLLQFTHSPSITSKLLSHMGKQPQETTLSVCTTEPRSRKSSKTSTMLGVMATGGGSTANTLWLTYIQTIHIIDQRLNLNYLLSTNWGQ